MSKIYLNLGKDGTFHFGYETGSGLKYYRNVEDNKTGDVDFFVDLEFNEPLTPQEAIKTGLSDFFKANPNPEFNRIYKSQKGKVLVAILLDEEFPHASSEIIELLIKCLTLQCLKKK